MAKFSRVVFAAAIAVGMSLVTSVKAEILVYDGFPTGSGAYSTTDGSKLKDQSVTSLSVIGFKDVKWQSDTGVIYSYASGLSLPEGFDALPSASLVGAGSVGTKADGSNDERGMWKTLSDATVKAIKSASELHYRVLLAADSKALGTLTAAGSENYVPNQSALIAGFCLSTQLAYGSARNSNGNTARAISFAIRRVGDVYKLSLLTMDAGDGLAKDYIRTYDLATYSTGKTYICYAKIAVGTGIDGKEKIEAWAQDVTKYDPTQEFQATTEAQLIDATGTGAPNAFDFACGSYGAKKGYFLVDEVALATAANDIVILGKAGAPVFEETTIAPSDGGYNVSGALTSASADEVGVKVIDPQNVETTFAGEGIAVEGEEVVPFVRSFATTNLTADATYAVSAYASNDVDTVLAEAGTIYTGTLVLEKVQDAKEKDAVPGMVMVSRANADPYPLTVNYKLTSVAPGAEAGKTWEEPLPVVIPENQTSATLTLVPKNDTSIDENITVTLALDVGNYVPSATTIDLVLENNSVPTDANVWVATADGLASDPSNWSYGRVPNSTDKVLFDGDYTSAACTWDADTVDGPSATIAALTVAANYTKTITILTTFPEVAASSFHTFSVTGDVMLNGGTITHGSHTSAHTADYYRLRMDVGGNLTVGGDAVITATGKGSFKARSNLASTYGGSYNNQRAWGSLTEPYGVGSSGNAGNEACWAGGAIWLEVAGTTALNGKLVANGVSASAGDTYTGSGGAIYLKSGTLSGVGTIAANGNGTDRSSNTKSSAGGRVSVLLTSGELTDFPPENITAYASYSSYANVGGAGTVLVRTPQKPNGILYLRDQEKKYDTYGYRPGVGQLTDIPKNEKWTLDGIVFGRNSILRVRADNELELVNGLESVSATSTERENGIYLDNGAKLTLPARETHTISSPWIFQANGGFVLNGNLALVNGGSIGTHNLYVSDTNATPRCEMRVTGNMTVDSDSFIWAQGGGYFNSSTAPFGSFARGSHGGQNAADKTVISYDSFFNPRYPGGFGDNGNYFPVGGGAVILTVDGDLTLDGKATASPKISGIKGRPGAAGTINLTVGSLLGEGSIEANGQKWDSQYDQGNYKGASGGGRVAVRLMKSGAAFSEYWKEHIFAKGVSTTWSGTNPLITEYASSAGSVYLQDSSQGECQGDIYIANDGNTSNTKSYTVIPARAYGGEDDVFDKASLSVSACAQVRLVETFKMSVVTLAADSKLDLNGNALTVRSAKLGDATLAAATYAASDYSDYLTDSVGGGSLVVTGSAKRGMVIIYR